MLKLTWGTDSGRGKWIATPRYCFLAQNAFYGLVANVIRGR